MTYPAHFTYHSNEVYVSDIARARFFHETLTAEYSVILFKQTNSSVPPEKVLSDMGVNHTDPICWAEAKASHWSAHKVQDGLFHIHAEKDADGIKYSFYVSAATKNRADEIMDDLTGCLPELTLVKGTIPMSFWACTERGPTAFVRELEVPDWSEIHDNYPLTLKPKLEDVMNLKPPFEGGRLLLWHGPPGTGKTTGIRALVRKWAPWCSAHYVVDPERFFGDATYMLSVLLSDTEEIELMGSRVWDDEIDVDYSDVEEIVHRWRLLVIEDAEDFLTPDAHGQALGRLLNVADGLIGQGLNLLILITTNKELSGLHKAVSREGRCLVNNHFNLFSGKEATSWLEERGVDKPTTKDMSLAQMYEILHERKQIKNEHLSSGVGQYI